MFATTRSSCRHLGIRCLATESAAHTPIPPPLPPLPPQHNPDTSLKPRASHLYPRPRTRTRSPATPSNHRDTLPQLPLSFGRNQLLPVPNSTRALLEQIVASFEAPIRYAFAYGSGVFEQAGYDAPGEGPVIQGAQGAQTQDSPMLDFVFAVNHPDHWHSINMHQFPGHYPLHARMLGSSFVARTQALGPGLWFNTFVPMHGVTIKYGVTTVDTLCADLLNWRTLYLAGRMHKPLRIIKDDARVRLTQQVNLTSALRTALLTLPSTFTTRELFARIAGISYAGDPRMLLPAENRGKISNIVTRQEEQFRELYWRLAHGLPGVRWAADASAVEQDISPHARAAHLKKLPQGLLCRVHERMAGRGPAREADETAYWLRIAGDETLPTVLHEEMSKIVRYPATVQSLKGIVSAGVVKSARYTTAKVGKWWKGMRSGSGESTS
ncbi:mitochondrial matrix Mmp37-domain-containing protein [Scleroderma yunnanense]